MEIIQAVLNEWAAPTVTIFLLGAVTLGTVLRIDEKLDQIVDDAAEDRTAEKLDEVEEDATGKPRP